MKIIYILFLDEFGHIGPFVSRADRSYNQHPAFGLAGIILPQENTRGFATWFYQLKGNMFSKEIQASGVHPAAWEIKGSDVFKSKNIGKYRRVKEAGSRLIKQIDKRGGKIIYYGRQKYLVPEKANASGLYKTVLSKIIRNANAFCELKGENFMMILDEHTDRLRLIATASKTMFGNNGAKRLIEPPLQVESHLYQTVQAADWIAALLTRHMAYELNANEFGDFEWASKTYGLQISKISTHSSIWRPPAHPSAP